MIPRKEADAGMVKRDFHTKADFFCDSDIFDSSNIAVFNLYEFFKFVSNLIVKNYKIQMIGRNLLSK